MIIKKLPAMVSLAKKSKKLPTRQWKKSLRPGVKKAVIGAGAGAGVGIYYGTKKKNS